MSGKHEWNIGRSEWENEEEIGKRWRKFEKQRKIPKERENIQWNFLD